MTFSGNPMLMDDPDAPTGSHQADLINSALRPLPDEAKASADKLRAEIRACIRCHDDNAGDTDNLVYKLAHAVCAYTTPAERIAELLAYATDDPVDSETERLEYNALAHRENTARTLAIQFDPDCAMGLALLDNSLDGVDLAQLIDQLKEQIDQLQGGDVDAVRRQLARNAVVAQHAGLSTLRNAHKAPTEEARASVTRYAISMLESSSRIITKLNSVGQSQNVYVRSNTANVAHNQQVVGSVKTRSDTEKSGPD